MLTFPHQNIPFHPFASTDWLSVFPVAVPQITQLIQSSHRCLVTGVVTHVCAFDVTGCLLLAPFFSLLFWFFCSFFAHILIKYLSYSDFSPSIAFHLQYVFWLLSGGVHQPSVIRGLERGIINSGKLFCIVQSLQQYSWTHLYLPSSTSDHSGFFYSLAFSRMPHTLKLHNRLSRLVPLTQKYLFQITLCVSCLNESLSKSVYTLTSSIIFNLLNISHSNSQFFHSQIFESDAFVF